MNETLSPPQEAPAVMAARMFLDLFTHDLEAPQATGDGNTDFTDIAEDGMSE